MKVNFNADIFETISESSEQKLIGGFSTSYSATNIALISGETNNCNGGNCVSGCGNGQNTGNCVVGCGTGTGTGTNTQC